MTVIIFILADRTACDHADPTYLDVVQAMLSYLLCSFEDIESVRKFQIQLLFSSDFSPTASWTSFHISYRVIDWMTGQ